MKCFRRDGWSNDLHGPVWDSVISPDKHEQNAFCRDIPPASASPMLSTANPAAGGFRFMENAVNGLGGWLAGIVVGWYGITAPGNFDSFKQILIFCRLDNKADLICSAKGWLVAGWDKSSQTIHVCPRC